MIEYFFSILELLDDTLWSYLGFPLIIGLGIFISILSKFVQLRKFPNSIKTFVYLLTAKKPSRQGVHPIKAFFATIGGCIGIGNIVAVGTAVQIGGPGALFWMWIVAILGMILKYAEVYLGIRYRVKNNEGGYNGGPMYYLQRVFKTMWVPSIVAVLLCIYGVEILQFSIVTNSLAHNFHLNEVLVAITLLVLVIYAGSGGVRRVGEISGAIIPLFILIYIGMGMWVLVQNITLIPGILLLVFKSAFTGHGAVGGFVGSTLMVTISQGIRRGCYASDVGIGYAAVIYSESASEYPERQSSLIFVDLFLDIFVVSTMSVLLILVTGVWQKPMHMSLLVQEALSQYFPYMHYFMPLFLLLLGYSTIIAYFCVGMKCAEFLSPEYGRKLFYVFATCFLLAFSFFESIQALTVMSLIQILLLFFNFWGIFRLRNDISYDIHKEKEYEITPPA